MIETVEDLAVGFHPASAPDYIPAQHMKDLQLGRLRAVVRRAWDHVALFRNRMEERGISPDRLRLSAICTVCTKPFLKEIAEMNDLLARESGGVVA